MLIHMYGQFSDVGLTDCDRIGETAKHLLSDSSKGGEGLSHITACWLVIISSFGPTYSDHEMTNGSSWGLLSAMVLDLILFLARHT